MTCLDTGVALPHADPQTIKKSRIILLTLKHPVDWGGTLVSLIVVTAFPEEEMNQIRDVINELYQLIGEKRRCKYVYKIRNNTRSFKSIS